MKIGKLCTRQVSTVYEHESVIAAAQKMRDDHVGAWSSWPTRGAVAFRAGS